MSYVIGSFNIRDFNLANKSRDGESIRRDFELIAQIIRQEKFDVVAIQEVNAEIAIKHLTDILNRGKNLLQEWEYDFSGKAATAIADPEGYGFIWNKKRLRLLEKRNKKNPDYYTYAGGGGLLRRPYYACFTSRGLVGGSNFELRIVNVHIRDATREFERLLEFNTLVQQVLPRICDHPEVSAENEIMPAYTFLMGDYNLELNKSERSVVKIETITETSYTGKKRYYKTAQTELTSLRIPREQTTISECYSHNYDHFTYETDLDFKLKLVPQRIEALSTYFPDQSSAVEKLSDFRLKVSDHVPIKLTVDLK